jgi:hypothetical protein
VLHKKEFGVVLDLAKHSGFDLLVRIEFYLYSTTGWCAPLWDDIGFPQELLLLDSLWK